MILTIIADLAEPYRLSRSKPGCASEHLIISETGDEADMEKMIHWILTAFLILAIAACNGGGGGGNDNGSDNSPAVPKGNRILEIQSSEPADGDFAGAFEKCYCIMMPVAPTTAFKMGEKIADPLQMYLSDIYTIAVNLVGVPGISVPCGFDEKGLPIGLQIIGPAFGEDKLLRIARMFEAQTDWHEKRPTIAS